MRKYLLAAIAALVLGGSALAQVCTTVNGYTSCSGPGGYHSWGQTYGNGYQAGGDNRGNRWTGQTYGNGTTFYNNRNICRLTGRC